jgi:WhiB family transcriptional regulator, redox-sensing transcriptional regulator
MVNPRTPASEDSPPTARTPDQATAGSPHPHIAGPFTDQALWARVISYARCADGIHDPEQWFPLNAEIDKARKEAAAAIAVCTGCPVRVQCLSLSFRHWDIGQHGVWGGLVAAERAALRQIVRANLGGTARTLIMAPPVTVAAAPSRSMAIRAPAAR